LGAPIVEAQSAGFSVEDDDEALCACGLQMPPGGPPPSRSLQSFPQRIHFVGSEQPSPQPASSEEVPSWTRTRESCVGIFFLEREREGLREGGEKVEVENFREVG
jgi:hypothetical protein